MSKKNPYGPDAVEVIMAIAFAAPLILFQTVLVLAVLGEYGVLQ